MARDKFAYNSHSHLLAPQGLLQAKAVTFAHHRLGNG